jgi:GrpB-like predicted nucleotidyltransferase (UPF0157 family)
VGEPVVIVEADPAWPERYEAERARLAAALVGHEHALEHCGSTSVPGLAAKPVIDVLLGVHEWPMAPATIAAVVGVGYEHRGDGGVPGREYFRRGVPRAYQVHACRHGGVFWRAHLAFRDRLRADRALAQEYEALKRALALRFPNDRLAYTDAKAPFIRRVLGIGLGTLEG